MDIREEYKTRYATMLYDPVLVKPIVDKIKSGQGTYEIVERETGVPWYIIGITHYKECSCDFTKHLHNGDPLTARTVRVPENRPRLGSPPFNWITSAKDALSDRPNKDWSIEGCLYWLEQYNGMGYRNMGVTNPYIWGGTQYYTKGLYVKDHVYDPNVVWHGTGVAILLKELSKVVVQPPVPVVTKSKWQIWLDTIKKALEILKKERK